MPEIVGYMSVEDESYCPGCWAALAAGGRRPTKLVTTEVGEKRDVFRVIDDCRRCGARIDYEDITLLD